MQKATLEQMQRAVFVPLPLSERLQRFVGRLPANSQWTIAITGKPGGGKSTFALNYMVPELVRAGKVLYFTSEEDLFQGTIAERAARGCVVHSPRLHFCGGKKINELKNELQTGNYAFCIIDSVNEFTDDDGKEMRVREVNGLDELFPKTSFIFIGQMEATLRRFAGGAKTAYRGDVVIRCEKRNDGAQIAYLDKYRYGSVDTEFVISKPEKKNPVGIKDNSNILKNIFRKR